MTKTRSTRIGAACGALAIATASMASACFPSVAAAQSAPTADRVWAQCQLSIDTVNQLVADMDAADTSNRLTLDPEQVAFVVIYSFQGNDGQQLTAGGFTGPVICRDTGVAINQVLQTDDISTTNVLDVENAIILRYGTANVEKRYCHTVDANTDCFRLR
jgi:hypothetical protein